MSGRTLQKTLRRDIASSLSRFLAIFAITALGACFFSGLRATGPDMKRTADRYYADSSLMDIRIVSPFGFTSEDINEVMSLPGISAVSAGYREDLLAEIDGGGEFAARFYSMPERGGLNTPQLIEGRMPQSDGECVIGGSQIWLDSIAGISGALTVPEGDAGTLPLSAREFTVVGIVRSPLYISKFLGPTALGGGTLTAFVYINGPVFSAARYTEMYALVNGADEVSAFSGEYNSLVDESSSEIKSLDRQYWFVFGRGANPGYEGFGSDADRIGALASVIPIFFFLVAALVCLTTMTRMVEDQRVQIGSLKAQGFSKLRVAYKYVAYAALASVSAAVLGTALGLYLFPATIWRAYGILYQMPEIGLIRGNSGIIALTLVISALVTTAAAFAACYGSLKSVPAALLRPKAPVAGKRVILERIGFIWRRLKFSQKIAARNLLLSKKRFFMTISGVLGCTALLLTGFGLRDAIDGIPVYQFGVIEQYDAAVTLNKPSGALEDTELNRRFGQNGALLYEEQIPADAENESGVKTVLTVSLTVCEDVTALPNFFKLSVRSTGETLTLTGSGVVLTEKLAKDLGVTPGDVIIVSEALKTGGVRARLLVTGIAENYVHHMIFISQSLFESAFDENAAFDLALCKLDTGGTLTAETRADSVSQLLATENVAGILDIRELTANVGDMLKSLDAVVWLIIGSAASLAFVTLFNLININITERIREIATLKVLGFTDNEIRNYIFRENRMLTFIGIALGLLGGVFLCRYVTGVAEIDEVMWRKIIKPLSFVMSALLSALFAELVNMLMRRRLRGIDMVESLKSAE